MTSDLTAAMKETMAVGFDTLQTALGKSPPTPHKGMLARMAKTAKNALHEMIGAASTTCRGMRAKKKGSEHLENEAHVWLAGHCCQTSSRCAFLVDDAGWRPRQAHTKKSMRVHRVRCARRRMVVPCVSAHVSNARTTRSLHASAALDAS